ncbi:NADH dehydrogenase [Cantharellus anzutake]|uniref:NADH dehydrogenase n=1 Tax=Cantharellus anzutake TaxID=1750568 RepID=UPI0019090163|nr:NADH dehydrogenase [Cantharellus anzutake]KAF8325238.1 NADH dehydrogenase [Cantharellus anzutake]
MVPKLRADHTLYHLSPKGFWKRLRDVSVVNPEISYGVPLPTVNRYPQPASRPEIQATPATKASDIAQNPYWKRDARRNYPQLSVVTQGELARLVLGSSQQPVLASPGSKSDVRLASKSSADLTAAIATISTGKTYSANNLPPTPPARMRWLAQMAEDAPHNPNAYWPMKLYGGLPGTAEAEAGTVPPS